MHYVWRVVALTLLTHLLPALVVVGWWRWPGVVAVVVVAWLVGLSRLSILVEDRPRSRWVVRWVDEPAFWHWGACAFGTVLLGPVWVALLLGDERIRAGGDLAALNLAAGLAYGVGAAVSFWSLWGIRRRLRVREVEVPLPGLASAFDGYRIAHLSDLHLGGLDPVERGLRWAKSANALRADLCAVTGDLVTSGTGYYDAAARVLGQLRAPDGVLVCLGNHDQWDRADLAARIERCGPRVLDNACCQLRRGEGQLTVAGVADASTGRADPALALAGCERQGSTVLLAHDPAVAESAFACRVDLVLSGHTHGGQIGLPTVGQVMNLTWLMGQPRTGLHRRSGGWLHVTSGLGTTGPPLRLGVPPEIALLVLRARPGNMAAR